MKIRSFMIIGLLAVVAVPGAIVAYIIYGFAGRSRLIGHHDLGSAQVVTCTKGVKGSPDACNVYYRYSVGGREYKGVTLFAPSDLAYEDCLGHLAGRSFPVVYEAGNAANSVILLSPGASRLYDYTFPDSLQWLSQYVHKK